MRKEYLAIHLRKSWSDVHLQLISFAMRHIPLTPVDLIVLLWRSFWPWISIWPHANIHYLSRLFFIVLNSWESKNPGEKYRSIIISTSIMNTLIFKIYVKVKGLSPPSEISPPSVTVLSLSAFDCCWWGDKIPHHPHESPWQLDNAIWFVASKLKYN